MQYSNGENGIGYICYILNQTNRLLCKQNGKVTLPNRPNIYPPRMHNKPAVHCRDSLSIMVIGKSQRIV